MERTKKEKGTSDTAVTAKRLQGKQLNLVFERLSIDELIRIKSSINTAINKKKDAKIKELEEQLENLKSIGSK
jgi:hypothetical protein